MSDLISREKLKKEAESLRVTVMGLRSGKGILAEYAKHYRESFLRMIDEQPTVEPVRGEWICWKEQCEYCMNRNTCPYPENQESMEALKQWEKENKFWGRLKLICDYYVLDKDKYCLDNPPECNAEG